MRFAFILVPVAVPSQVCEAQETFNLTEPLESVAKRAVVEHVSNLTEMYLTLKERNQHVEAPPQEPIPGSEESPR